MQEGSTSRFRWKATEQSLFRHGQKGTLHVSHIRIVLGKLGFRTAPTAPALRASFWLVLSVK